MKNMKLSARLLIYFLGMGLAVVIGMGVISYFNAKDAVIERSLEQLVTIRDTKKKILNDLMEVMKFNITVMGASDNVKDVVRELRDYEQNLGIGSDDKFLVNTPEYKALILKYEPYFQMYLKTYGYHDILIIDSDKQHGHVFYTFAKEADLGENIASGQYKDTHLAAMWRKVVETKTTHYADLQNYAPSDNKPAMFLGTPITIDGNVEAVLVFQIPADAFDNIANFRAGMGETGESFFVGKSQDGNTTMRNNRVIRTAKFGDKKVGEDIDKAFKGETGTDFETLADGNVMVGSYTPAEIPEVDWAVFATQDLDEVMKPVIAMRNTMALIGLIAALGVFFVAWFTSKSLSRKLIIGVDFAQKVAAGNYDTRLDIKSNDEIGMLYVALNEMVMSFNKGVIYAKKISEGDLRTQSDTDLQELKNNPLIESMRNMESKLNAVVSNVSEIADELTFKSLELSQSSSEIASGSNEQAASTEQVSASMEEMVSNINQTAFNAQNAATIALKAEAGITEGKSTFDMTVSAMREIAAKISIIGEIAQKTDILAINAAIEAARAGVHGRGFAVVAGEIRKLAENSQKAAAEINTVVDKSVNIAERSAKQMQELVPQIQQNSIFVQEINMASKEQNSGADQINNAIQELTKVTQQNSISASSLSESSFVVSRQAEMLKETINFFTTDTDKKNIKSTQKSKPDKSFVKYETGKEVRTADINLNMSSGDDDDDFVNF